MHADYIANPLYDNNPFIEALPPMLSGKDLIRALAVIPPYSDSDRDRSTGERLQLLSSLYEFYQPLSMTIDLYCEIYTAMQHCYGQYSIQSEAAAMQNSYSLMHGNALAASIGGGNSFPLSVCRVLASQPPCSAYYLYTRRSLSTPSIMGKSSTATKSRTWSCRPRTMRLLRL